MGERTGIGWTDHTLNPIIGCTRVSPGCENCYAEKLATTRMGVKWGNQGDRRITKNWQRDLLKWNKAAFRDGERRRVFIASLSDVFEDHPAWNEEVRPRLVESIEQCYYLDHLLLTKRTENILRFTPESWKINPPRQVWFMTTTENQKYYDLRWPLLAKVPAWTRGISYEPALGDLTLTPAPDHNGVDVYPDWVICGGESGNRSLDFRMFSPDWAHHVLEQCRNLGIAFYMKQMAGYDSPTAAAAVPHQLRVHEFPRTASTGLMVGA